MAGLRTSWRASRLLSRANALLTRGKAAEAEPLCHEALALAPRSANAWISLSAVYFHLNRFTEALEACDRALDIAPRNAAAWANKGVALNRLKRYEEALEALSHVSLGHADESVTRNANWARIITLEHMGRLDAAQAEAERLIRHNPDEPRHWYWLGTALDALKRHDEALSAYARSTKLDHLYVDGWVGQAYALYDLRRYDEGLSVSDRILNMEPQNLRAWRVKALCLLKERRFSEAIAVYDRILASPGLLPSDHSNKGFALVQAGRYVDAARAFTQALTLKPGSPTYLHNIACVYTRLQHYERALDRLDDARDSLMRAAKLREMPGADEHHACLVAWQGILHTRQGQYDEAMAAFKEALAADPDNSEACWGFAELLLALGETDKASRMIERSLTLDPFDARAWSLKARILRAAGDERGAAEAEAHGQRMLSEQRALLAAWEREQAGQAGE
jgi:tetratricopeptide (TPR) repeat protein